VAVEKGVYNYNTPLIVIPPNIYSATKEMCQTSNKSRGMMLSSDSDSLHIIYGMIMLGYGDLTETQYDQKRLQAAKQLLQERKDLSSIGYQTDINADEAIRTCISFDLDSNTMTQALKKYPDYKHVIFTPKEIIIIGFDKSYITVAAKPNLVTTAEMAKITNRFSEILNQ